MNETQSNTNILLFGENPSVAIVTLWTPVDMVAKRLDKKQYGIIGNLYNAERGLDALTRSLISNPQIKHLVITGSDMGKSGVVLADFFEKGVVHSNKKDTGAECWKVQSAFDGYIDIQIPEPALNDLRQSVSLYHWNFTEPFTIDWKEPPKTRAAFKFEKKTEFVKKFFGEPAGFVFRAKGFAEAWLLSVDSCLKIGISGKSQKSLFQTALVLTPDAGSTLKIPAYFEFSAQDAQKTAEEWFLELKLSALNPNSGDFFSAHSISMLSGQTASVQVQKVSSQMALLVGISKLSAADAPLVLASLQALAEKCRLFGPSVFACLNVTEYIVLNSDAERFTETINSNFVSTVTPARLIRDWRGNMVIYISHGEIVVEHVSPNNELLWMYTGKTALEIRDQLMREGIVGTIAHAIYLGTELSKAETAFKLSLKYVQDQPLDFEKKDG